MPLDTDEEFVRSFLAEVPLPEGRLDLPAVLDRGHARTRRRRAGQAGLALLAAVAVAAAVATPRLLSSGGRQATAATPVASVSGSASPAGSGAPSPGGAAPCPATKLPVPAGASHVEVTTVDPTGRYIGGISYQRQNGTPVLWTDRVPAVLPIHRDSVEIDSINSSGVVVGLAGATHGYDDVYRYRDGAVTFLTPPPGKWLLFPKPAINARGDIVINAEPRDDRSHSFAFYWPAGSDTAKKIPLPAGATVFAISDDGTLVGDIHDDGTGYTWDLAGHGTRLATPAGKTTAGYGIRGDWVVGGVWGTGSRDISGGVWNLRTGQVTVVPGADPMSSVNSSGWTPIGPGVWVGDKTRPLAQVEAGYDSKGVAIADTGLVVGSGAAWHQPGSAGETPIIPLTWKC